MSMQVVEKVIRMDREPSPEEKASTDINYTKGELSQKDMVDGWIESDECRKGLKEGEGEIAITVQAGEELGQFAFNIQFEGQKGEYEFCMEGQNDLLINASEWLQLILGEFAEGFNVQIEAKPCLKADQKLEIEEAAQVLEKKSTVQNALARIREREKERKRKREHGRRREIPGRMHER